MRITIKRAYWHDPTGFIEPTPITHTVGQHHLKFHRPVLGTEDMAIRELPYTNFDNTRKIIITDLLRRVNALRRAQAAEPPPPPAPSAEETLLGEIRDLLKSGR